MAGTPEWAQLDHDDPCKLAAVLDASRHWALRVDTCQEALADTSREIAAAADWSRIARDGQARGEFYAQRPWMKQVHGR